MFFVWGSPAQKTCDDIGIDEVGVHSFISGDAAENTLYRRNILSSGKMFTDYSVSSLKEFI